MSNLQKIIDNATNISFTRNRVAARTISRSGRLLTSEIASAVPYQISVSYQGALKYSTNRALVEELDRLDITLESEIDVGNTNPRLAYITQYQGDIATAQIANITCASASGNTLVLNTSSASGSGLLFRKGDLIQPDTAYRYPYTVTADVTFSATATLNIPIHRAFLSQTDYTLAGKGIKVGSAVSWRVKQISKPTYRILPHDLLIFEGDFGLVEVVL